MYIQNAGVWVELSGTDRPYAKVTGTWQGIAQGYAKVAGIWQQVYLFDTTPPSIGSLTVSDQITGQNVSWQAITDAETNVVSATLYQIYVGSISGPVIGSSFNLTSFGAGSTVMAVPISRRQQGSLSQTWSAYYYIVATDATGNTITGPNSNLTATTPYDIVGPTVSTPTVSNQATTHYITWPVVTDAVSSVIELTLKQTYTGSVSGVQPVVSYDILTANSNGNISIAIPNNRRQQGTSGETWSATYYIVAKDFYNNTVTGNASTSSQTSAYDIVGPVVYTPGVVNGTSTQTISWVKTLDAVSSVTELTLYQEFTGSVSGIQTQVDSYNILSTNASVGSGATASINVNIPNNRRQQGASNQSWSARYYIVAKDSFNNITTGSKSTAVTTTAYDIVGPTVSTPTVSNQTSTQIVSWTKVTDSVSSVSSLSLEQIYTGSTSGAQAVISYDILSANANAVSNIGTYTVTINNNRRQQPASGQTWTAKYRIVATDSYGNTTTGSYTSNVQTTAYDVAGPGTPIPIVTSGVSSDTVEWTTISDNVSGTASAVLYQGLINETLGTTNATYQVMGIASSQFNGGSTSVSIPNGIRNVPNGNVYKVFYWIEATDNSGNVSANSYLLGGASTPRTTKPLGDFMIVPNAADSRNMAETAWLGLTSSITDEGAVGVSATGGTRSYGAYFYPTNAFSNVCRNWAPDSGSIFLQRPADNHTSRGNSGTFTMQGHLSASKPSGNLSYVGGTTSVYIAGNNGVGSAPLTALQRTYLGNGSIKGFAMTDHSNTPGFLRGYGFNSNNNPYGIVSGTVFLTFT